MPLPHRALRLRLLCLAVAAGLVVPLAGCNFFQLLPVRNDKADPLKGDLPRVEQTGAKVAVEANPANLPVKCQYRLSQYLFLADFELQRDLPLFKELAELREQVHKTLQLPPSTRLIQVCLFEDKERYERFMVAKYPYLPKRRAFFVAEPRPIGGEELMVYTFWGNGERIEQDLRHELTHALLHSVLKDVPLWLDEGLAEYFEIAPGKAAINAEHMKHLRHGPTGLLQGTAMDLVQRRVDWIDDAMRASARTHGCRFHRAWYARDGTAFYAIANWDSIEGARACGLEGFGTIARFSIPKIDACPAPFSV